ncbi:MAG TPA: DUF4307 domain-containing protein [Actinomycetes bacterium]|nr:DUF4307 domain-containing protein [Actinomycetes bacterium]
MSGSGGAYDAGEPPDTTGEAPSTRGARAATSAGSLAERYGRRAPMRRSARIAWVAAGLVALLAVSAGVTAMYLAGRPKVSLSVRAYQVVSDDTVTAVVEVDKPAGRSAACEVRALDAGMALVGARRVAATGTARHVRLSVTIPTTTRAFGVRPGACVLD